MRYLNNEEMKKEVRKLVVDKYDSFQHFANELGIDRNAVYAVLNQKQRKVPESWMGLLGYERVTVYKKK